MSSPSALSAGGGYGSRAASPSSSASSPSRKQCDFTKLMMAGYDVELKNGNTRDFFVEFLGPKDTPYEGGVFKVHVELPDQYPYVSPSIGFVNKIFHPNIDERSGSVCLDVINQTWTPLYSLVNVFEVFLPQLLTYPNPTDPLNSEAASMLMREKEKYEEKVKNYVTEHAAPKEGASTNMGGDNDDNLSELSGAGSNVDFDMDLDLDDI